MPHTNQDTPREVIVISDNEAVRESSNGDVTPPPNNQAAISGNALRDAHEELRQVR